MFSSCIRRAVQNPLFCVPYSITNSFTFSDINTSSKPCFVSTHNQSFPLNLGCNRRSQFCTNDKLYLEGSNHFLRQWVKFHASAFNH